MDSLRRLVDLGSFNLLQDKIEQWQDDYRINSTYQNVTRGADILELNARVQSQIYRIVNLAAAEGGTYGYDLLKNRLLPWVSSAPFGYPGWLPYTNATLDSALSLKRHELNEMSDMYERSLNNLEHDLNDTRAAADDLKAELEDTKDELDTIKRASTNDKMFADAELRELKAKLHEAENENISLRVHKDLMGNYERQIQRLKDDLNVYSGSRALTSQNGDYDPLPLPAPRLASPLDPDDVTQRVRQQSLMKRFNDMFSFDRLDAMDILRRYSSDNENNQRILFAAMQEAFSAARLAFAKHKMQVRSNLAITHRGPETLEEAVQDYINRHIDLYDLQGLISDVIRALNRNPKLLLPATAPYSVIQPFVREACKVAWGMSALAHPLEVALASDAELHDEHKYRRSYDSDYTAPLVNHHIWPALMQGLKVLIKGEANTRRGASLNSSMRSLSPSRAASPSRSRARSPSPSRLASIRSRSASPNRRSRLRERSPSPRPLSSLRSSHSRVGTASTALSHYGVKS